MYYQKSKRMIKFSLIIPIYQVEEFLDKCLESCISQDLAIEEYEIIIINDGSKDNSLQIAERFRSLNQNIYIHSQKNKGLSEARNAGLLYASGKYIWFIDSDDWVRENCLNELFTICEDNDLDILHFNATDNSKEKVSVREENQKFYNTIISGKEYIKRNKFITFPVCFNIFKKSFLDENKIHFKSGVFHEDNEFSPRVFYFANKVSFKKKSYYNVYHNPNSITRKVNSKKSFDLLIIIDATYEFLKKNVLEEEIRYKFYNYMGLAFNAAVENIISASNNDRRLFALELIDKKEIISKIKKSTLLQYKAQIIMFEISILLYLNFYTLIKKKKLVKW